MFQGGQHAPEYPLYGDNQYNGNISGMKWQTTVYPGERGYGFQYDDLNRLTDAWYAMNDEETPTPWTNDINRYSTNDIEYDYNGNIKFLERKGKKVNGSYNDIDDLEYYYNGNKLIGVNDDIPDNETNVGDFHDNGLEGLVDVNDPSTYEYLYDANGVKLHKTLKQYDNPNWVTTSITEYSGNIVYDKDPGTSALELEYILTDQGRITPTATGYRYEYFLKDHLGNIVYDKDPGTSFNDFLNQIDVATVFIII